MALTSFGYVYHLSSTAQNVPVGSNVIFNKNGPLRNITHVASSSRIRVALAGVYNIAFAIYTSVNNPEVWGVAVNGVVKSRFSADGKSLNAITSLHLNAGDIVQIRNVATEPNPAVLRIGDRTAWVLIYKAD
ncbi:MAG: hypothetical protein ACM3MK_05780 [Chitinophagales bacterium]